MSANEEFIEITTTPKHEPIGETKHEKPRKRRKNNLDSAKNDKIRNQLYDWWTQEREYQSENRLEQNLDADFKDGLQWSDEDAADLRERGQAPLVYNRVKPAVDWVLGTEKRSRVDFKIHGRSEEDIEEAQSKTELLKYVSDVNKCPFSRSQAFAEAVTSGVGWLEDGIQGDNTEDPIFSRMESWRNIWYDHHAIERDLTDARYIFRSKYIDLDIAQAMFPDRADVLKKASILSSVFSLEDEDDDEYYLGLHYQRRDTTGNIVYRNSGVSSSISFNRRERVRLIECWFRQPVTKRLLRGGLFAGMEFDPANEGMAKDVEYEYASVYDAITMQMFCAVMTEDKLLQLKPSPYKHNEFPFTPVWGYKRSRDNAPYGMIRNLRDPQENLNKRMSKALHILSTNQIIAEEDAHSDWDQIREEAARPDGMLLLDGRRDARFELNNDKSLAREHLNLMEIDAKMIQDVSGITDENLGKETNAESGKAVIARQEQGSVITAELFDNFRYAFQIQGEKQLSLIEQFYDQPKTLRILGDNGEPEFKKLNDIRPLKGQAKTVNDMTARKADFIVDESEYRASMRRAMFEMFQELFKSMDPEVTMGLMDLMFEYSDLPGRDEIVSRIRKLNGQSDPDKADDPEEIARIKAEQEKQLEQERLLLERVQLENQKLKAEANKLNAEAQEKLTPDTDGEVKDPVVKALETQSMQLDNQKKAAEIQKIKADAVGSNVDALFSSTQVAEIVALLPETAVIADNVAGSAGFIDKNVAPIIPTPAKASKSPVSRQERTLIQRRAGAEKEEKDTSPNTPASSKSTSTAGKTDKSKTKTKPKGSTVGASAGKTTKRAD